VDEIGLEAREDNQEQGGIAHVVRVGMGVVGHVGILDNRLGRYLNPARTIVS